MYTPTAAKEEEAIESYQKINGIIEKNSRPEILIIMGDDNSKLGAGIKTHYIGAYGLGITNER